AFELASRNDVDALGAFLEAHGMTVVDPPGEYYGRSYYAVYFTDPDGMKLEAMVYKPPAKQRRGGKKRGVDGLLRRTRSSCVLHCKYQAGNNGSGQAIVSHSRRLVLRSDERSSSRPSVARAGTHNRWR